MNWIVPLSDIKFGAEEKNAVLKLCWKAAG